MMPRCRLLARHWIDNTMREPGDIVEIDWAPSLEMEPLDKAGKEAIAAFKAKLAGLQLTQPNYGLTHYQLRNSTMIEDLLRGLRQ